VSALSARGQGLVGSESPLIRAHFDCLRDPYDATTNPDGFVNFGTAENHLVWDLVAPRLAAAPPLVEADAHYAPMQGTEAFRAALARYLSALIACPVAAQSLVVAAGCSALVEALGFALADAGDAFVIPAPYYGGFSGDLGHRAGVALIPVPLAAPAFRLDPAALEAAIVGAGRRVRALLLTSPDNPLGVTYDAATLTAALDVAARHDLHVIVDEIYAGSSYGAAFVSARAVPTALARDRLHTLYGLAKDVALSGFKVGVLHTLNPTLLSAVRTQALFGAVSTATQALLTPFIAGIDDAFRERLHERLRTASTRTRSELAAAGIDSVPASAGLFVWVDLRRFLTTPTRAAELALHATILAATRVNLSPGAAFFAPEPGWFRLCFAQPEPARTIGVARLVRHLAATA